MVSGISEKLSLGIMIGVTFVNGLHLAHVPMSPWARASGLDEWMWFIKRSKVLDLENWMI